MERDRALGIREIYDARLAYTLLRHGVTEFATRNPKHFARYGFSRIWNPIDEAITNDK